MAVHGADLLAGSAVTPSLHYIDTVVDWLHVYRIQLTTSTVAGLRITNSFVVA
jgi:hypothetical protein